MVSWHRGNNEATNAHWKPKLGQNNNEVFSYRNFLYSFCKVIMTSSSCFSLCVCQPAIKYFYLFLPLLLFCFLDSNGLFAMVPFLHLLPLLATRYRFYFYSFSSHVVWDTGFPGESAANMLLAQFTTCFLCVLVALINRQPKTPCCAALRVLSDIVPTFS